MHVLHKSGTMSTEWLHTTLAGILLGHVQESTLMGRNVSASISHCEMPLKGVCCALFDGLRV